LKDAFPSAMASAAPAKVTTTWWRELAVSRTVSTGKTTPALFATKASTWSEADAFRAPACLSVKADDIVPS